MTIQRKIVRANEKKQVREKRQQKTSTEYKVLRGLAAAALFALPAWGQVAEAAVAGVVPVAGSGTTVAAAGNNKINVNTTAVVNNNSINRFQEFKVNANEMVNLNLVDKTDNVFNLVRSQVDINGIVNAIKNNQIGGNAYFLSSQGIVVGATGVINAGSVHLAVPSTAEFDTLDGYMALNTNNAIANVNSAQGQLNKYTNNHMTAVPLNADGTITVLGKIHTADGIEMHATHIGVGVAADAEGTKTAGALLQSGRTDFSDVVNIKDAAGGIIVDSGIAADKMQITTTGKGEIYLDAHTEKDSSSLIQDVKAIEKTLSDLGLSFTTTVDGVEQLVDGVVKRNYNADIKVNGTLDAQGNQANENAGDITLTAKAANGVGAQLTDVSAKIDVADGSSITGANVKMSAVADNTYVDSDSANHATAAKILGQTPLKMDISYAVLGTEASVNIGQGANVTAVAGDVDIEAKSSTSASLGTTVDAMTLFNTPGHDVTKWLPGLGVSFLKQETKGTINVDGVINASGSTNLTADSKLNMENVNNVKLSVLKAESQQFVLAASYADMDNKAEVTVGSTGSINATTGDLALNAVTNNDINSEVTVQAGDGTAVVTAINIGQLENRAKVDVNGSLTAGGDVAVKANNTVERLAMNTTNSIGASKFMANFVDTAKGNVMGNLGSVLGGLKTTATNFSPIDLSFLGSLGGGEDETSFSLGDYLSAGATISSADILNSSAVNIAGNVNITAGKDIVLDANTTLKDVNVIASGKSSSYKKDNDVAVVANVAMIYAGVDNYATVDLAKGTGKLAAGKNVKATANAVTEYNRVNNMVADVVKSVDFLKESIDSFNDIPANLKGEFNDLLGLIEEYKSLAENLKLNPESLTSTEGWEQLGADAADGVGYLNKGLAILDKVNKVRADIVTLQTAGDGVAAVITTPVAQTLDATLDVVSNAFKFADYNNYANFAASSKAKAGTQAGSEDTTPLATLAGSLVFTNLDNNAKVLIGQNRQIEANNNVALTATNATTEVVLNGVNPLLFNSGGGANAVGGSVTVQNYDNNAIVLVGEGAGIKAGSIDVNSAAEVSHYSLTQSGGKGGNAINGMVGLVFGESNALVSVDDEANLTATNGNNEGQSGQINIGAKNDTMVVNVAGGLALGKENAAVGAAVALNSFDVNTIADIGNNQTTLTKLWDNAEQAELGFSSFNEDEGETKKDSKIEASGLAVKADTTGLVNAVSIAGSAIKGSSGSSKSKDGLLDSLKNIKNNVDKGKIGQDIANKLTGEDSLLGKAFGYVEGGLDAINGAKTNSKVTDAMNINGSSSGGGNVNANGASGSAPSFSLAAAGSASVNMLDNKTEATVSGVNINLKNGNLDVKAKDSGGAVAASGAAAVNWQSNKQSNGVSVALEGAVGLNAIEHNVAALVDQSVITNANQVKVEALSGGLQVAAGLGLDIVKASGSGKSYQGGASVSVNLLDNDVAAKMTNTAVTSGAGLATSGVDVVAYENDVQVTGGAKVSVGNSDAMAGGSVVVADINNKLKAAVENSTLTDMANTKVHGVDALTSVAASLAVGVATDSDSKAFMGSAVY